MPRVDLREDETTEFKERWTKEALKDIAAFANHEGGTLFVGVQDDGEVVGFKGGDTELQRIVNQIVDALGLNPQVELRKLEGRPVVAIQVTPSPQFITYRGRYYTRTGNTHREMTSDQLRRRALETSGRSWDALLSSWGLDAVARELIVRFTELARDRLRAARPEDPPERILQNLQLVHEGQLTNAAVLLFAQAPQALYPQARVRIGRFKGSEILDSHDFEGALWNQLDRAMEKFRDMLEVRFEVKVEEPSLEGLQRKETWEYPLEALREALTNALIHRDYSAPGDIQVRVYDDRLTIWNPGGLPEGVRLEELYQPGHHSVLRNPLLARAFYRAGLIEQWGTGTTLIVNLCGAQGLPEPVFEDLEGGGFRVEFVKDPYTPERLRTLGLTERQLQAVLYVKEKGSISNGEYQELTGVSKPTATRDLDDLVKRALFVKKGTTGRGTRYELKGSERNQRDHDGLRKGSPES